MLEDQLIALDGVTYRWMYDENRAPRACWDWANAATYTKPGAALVARLNKHFVAELAGDVAATLDRPECERFAEILDAMGASRETLLAVFGMKADSLPPRLRLQPQMPLPSAANLPFNNPAIRDWFFGSRMAAQRLPGEMSILGEGPFGRDDLTNFFRSQQIKTCELAETSAVVVLGREGWSRDDVDVMIDWRVGQILRIYSQEMFVSFLATKADPFYADPNVLEAFKAGHPGLEFVSRGWQGWVTTYVDYDRRNRPAGRSLSGEWVEQSPLCALGYHVGKTGVTVSARREILERAFKGELPIVAPFDYMSAWGEPGSPTRLKKIADSISTHSRNMKSRFRPSYQAILDWESDLEWLRDTFYHGHMIFAWPAMLV